MVDSGNVTWDLVVADGWFAKQACDEGRAKGDLGARPLDAFVADALAEVRVDVRPKAKKPTENFANVVYTRGVEASEIPEGDDWREGLVAVISVRMPEPQFGGQSKRNLGSREINTGLGLLAFARHFGGGFERGLGGGVGLLTGIVRVVPGDRAERQPHAGR